MATGTDLHEAPIRPAPARKAPESDPAGDRDETRLGEDGGDEDGRDEFAEMAEISTDGTPDDAPASRLRSRGPLRNRRSRRRVFRQFRRFFDIYMFSSLTKRIVFLNLAALAAVVSGILYLNQFREGLIEARTESLRTQGSIIAGAISETGNSSGNTAPFDPDRLLKLEAGEGGTSFEEQLKALEFSVSPEHIAPILYRVISPTKTHARVFDRDGLLLVDSRTLFHGDDFLGYRAAAKRAAPQPGWLDRMWQSIMVWLRRGELPLYKDLRGRDGKQFREVAQALEGKATEIERVTGKGELVLSVAVPIQRYGTVLGALMLTTEAGDIDAIISAERMGIFRVFLVAALPTLILSILLAGTIAGPVRRLAAAAERVRRGVKSREEIPAFVERQDEIGHLARAFRGMTNALYDRIAAIERFAADVSHELKNPLTSLRSAVETLPLVRKDSDRERLLSVIMHDVKRLDRLITDISEASRIDAELQRETTEPIDVGELLEAVAGMANDSGHDDLARVDLALDALVDDKPVMVTGHASRLSRVFLNLIDNARSFAPTGSAITISATILKRQAEKQTPAQVQILVDDEGPGIENDNFERIFQRFYTDRVDRGGFGNHSGLGLSISRQIVSAHDGSIRAENRRDPGTDRILGARFVVTLPLA